MTVPEDLFYTRDHEWVRSPTGHPNSGLTCRVGITATAADALGDVVFVDLPSVGSEVQAGEVCGEVESTKAVSDLFAPLSGVIVAVNQVVIDDPALINEQPYDDGWLFDLEVVAGTDLLNASQYKAWTAE